MLWHPALSRKAWLDTRARFVTGLVLLLFAAGVTVYSYDRWYDLGTAGLSALDLEQLHREELFAAYRPHVWNGGIRSAIRQLTALFAVVIAAGGLLSQASRGGGTFMLSLPVTRQQLLWTRTIVGLLELAALTLLPMLLIRGLSAALGQSYSTLDAVVYALCLFVGGSVLFSATTLLSTVFSDVWRPPLIALCGVIIFGFVLMLLAGPSSDSLLGVMTGEAWFREQRLPVVGLLMAAAVSAALLYLTKLRLARLDF